MNTKQRSILQSMMRPYQGDAHAVVAFGLSHGQVDFISAGRQISGAPSADWIFEIGSITKVFTAILVCLLEEEGQVDPRAPLREMSDLLADVPDHITPERLSAHISGLPRLHVPVWKALIHPLPADPYAAFSRAYLLDWLHHWRGTAPGAKPRHRYSNLGMGLLGEAMAMRMNTPFVDLLTDKVLMPLGMGDTVAQLGPDQQPRFAAPHNTKGSPVPAWSFQAMAAAGCLRSSPRDLARFSQQVIRAVNAPETKLDRAICRPTQPIFGLSPRGRMDPAAQCAGWMSRRPDPAQPGFVHHDGATAGSSCALYICPEQATACAILSNTGVEANLWTSAKLSWSGPLRLAHQFFMAA